MRNTHPQDDEVHLAEIWHKMQNWFEHIWKRKRWILGISIVFATTEYIRESTAPPIYNATLTFSLEQGNGKSSLTGLASQFGLSTGGDGGGIFSGENLLALMKSRRLVEDVLMTQIQIEEDSTLLIDQFIRTSPEYKECWESTGLYPFDKTKRYHRIQDSALGAIHKVIVSNALVVNKQDQALNFVTINYSGHDERFTGNFVEQLAKRATEFYIESKTANNRANMAKLQRRVDSVSSEMQLAMVDLASLQDQNSFTVNNIEKVQSQQKQLKVNMLTTLYGELVKNLELSKTMAAREEPLITVVDYPHYPLRVRKSKLKSTFFCGMLGGVLTVLFFSGQEFFRDLNKQAAALKLKA